MLKEIEQLLPLQELDEKIYKIKVKLSEFQPLYDDLTSQIDNINSLIKEKEEGLLGVKKLHREKELELKEKEEELKKLQSKLFQVKTNREYSAIQEGINKAKEAISNLEEEILKVLDDIEVQEKEKDSFVSEKKNEIKKLEDKIAEIKGEEAKLKKELEALSEQRKVLAEKVDANILDHYEKILEHNSGKALCKVTQKGVCSGCYLSLPAQVVNELMMGNKLIYCEGCGSILYYSEE